MGWKASGTVTDETTIAAEIPLSKGDPNKPNLQYEAAIAAVGALLAASDTGPPWDVHMQGSGESYPTARVQITVDGEGAVTGPVVTGWATPPTSIEHPAQISALTFEDPTDSPVAAVELAAAKAGAMSLVSSETVGNTRPWHVALSGDATETGWSITVIVRRPVAEGYQ